jgi:hypothetical protein
VSHTSVSEESAARIVSRGNRRVSIRYRCAPATAGKVISANDHEFQRAWILDMSHRGIGMELSRPLESGRLVIISIRSNTGTKVYEFPATVVHCDLSLQGSWYVGCQLSAPLSHDELDQLL